MIMLLLNMTDIIIILILVIILFFSVKGAVSHFKGEGSCCGGGGRDVVTKPRKLGHVIKIREIRIDGMHCKHCYVRVSNALNSMDGMSAVVKGRKGKAVVKMEKDYGDDELKDLIERLGYTVVGISSSD